MLDRFENFSLLISEIHKLIVKISSEEMKKYGLQSPSARFLLVLNKKGKCTAALLSRITGKNKAEISRTISSLEEKELIEKEASSTNYRVTIRLTERGKETAEAIEKAAIKAVSAASEGVSDEDRETMYNALDQIAQNLQKVNVTDI